MDLAGVTHGRRTNPPLSLPVTPFSLAKKKSGSHKTNAAKSLSPEELEAQVQEMLSAPSQPRTGAAAILPCWRPLSRAVAERAMEPSYIYYRNHITVSRML